MSARSKNKKLYAFNDTNEQQAGAWRWFLSSLAGSIMHHASITIKQHAFNES
jgi:hypothetical protein